MEKKPCIACYISRIVEGGGIHDLPLTVNPNLKTDAPSISQEMVDDFIAQVETQTWGDRTTVVKATLRNGFTIVESSSCVSPENYDEMMGKRICMKAIKDKVWFLLGFLLQSAVAGFDAVDRVPYEEGQA